MSKQPEHWLRITVFHLRKNSDQLNDFIDWIRVSETYGKVVLEAEVISDNCVRFKRNILANPEDLVKAVTT